MTVTHIKGSQATKEKINTIIDAKIVTVNIKDNIQAHLKMKETTTARKATGIVVSLVSIEMIILVLLIILPTRVILVRAGVIVRNIRISTENIIRLPIVPLKIKSVVDTFLTLQVHLNQHQNNE